MRRFLSIMSLMSFTALHSRTLHVSVAGDDGGDGSSSRPLASLVRARDVARGLRKSGEVSSNERIIIELGRGTYRLSSHLELGAEDSFTEYKGVGAVVSGGIELRGFKGLDAQSVKIPLDRVAAKSIKELDLSALGIKDYGKPSGGWGNNNRDFGELFYKNVPMGISRWPNGDELVAVAEPLGETAHAIHGNKGCREGVFRYDGDRASRWVAEPDAWCHGWWFWDWADQRQKIQSIDVASKTIALTPPHHTFGYRKGQWYYVYNALSELDAPGEWCLDTTSGKLYFWPPEGLEDGDVVYSISRHLVLAKDCRDVRFSGIVFEHCRNTAAVVHGGSGVVFAGCTFRNTGTDAVSLGGGSDHVVRGCDMYQLGSGGVSAWGGDRKTLTKCNHLIENCHIHHYARWTRILTAAVDMNGCGVRIANNLIHDAPHMAIKFTGNDHLIENNEIHSVCYETNDAGAIYSGRNWTFGGTVVRNNYLHHITGFQGRGCVGIYMDDSMSQIHVYGNLFFDVCAAMFIGGGRSHLVEGNVFVDCRPALHIDARGLGWSKPSIDSDMKESYRAMPVDSELWKSRFPYLQGLLDDEPGAPKYNIVRSNVFWGGKWDRIEAKARPYQTLEDNVILPGPFNGQIDFQLGSDSPIWKSCPKLKRIELESIGLHPGADRASWPVVHEIRPRGTEKVKKTQAEQLAQLALKTAKAVKVAMDEKQRQGLWEGTWRPAELDGFEMLALEEGVKAEPVELKSIAYLFHDGSQLYALVSSKIAASTAVPDAGQAKWGGTDAVELAFRHGGKDSPIVIYRGFINGDFMGSDEAGAKADQVASSIKGAHFKVLSRDSGRWDAMISIPLSNFGYGSLFGKDIPFAIAVRKTVGNQWVFWKGGPHTTWNVDKTGFLRFE